MLPPPFPPEELGDPGAFGEPGVFDELDTKLRIIELVAMSETIKLKAMLDITVLSTELDDTGDSVEAPVINGVAVTARLMLGNAGMPKQAGKASSVIALLVSSIKFKKQSCSVSQFGRFSGCG